MIRIISERMFTQIYDKPGEIGQMIQIQDN
jgi:hypothetical protein